MTLKTVFQGDSVTIGFNLIGYDVARIQDLKIYLGSILYPHTIDGSVVRCELSSDLTANLLGIKPIFFWIDDTVFGVKNFNAGDIDFSYANPVHNGSINSGFDVIVNLNINQTEILVDSVLFDYFRGQNAYENAVLGGYSGTESEFNVMMSGFPNQEQTRISNENERISWYNVAINAISSALSTITGTNAEVVSQEAIRINSENIRIDSENTRVSWYNTAVSWYNNAVAATATAISNAITATTQANAARDAANAAANAGGSPKDSYLTLAALQAAFPTGTTGVYLVTENGHWYSWKGGAWTDGGVYLGTPNVVSTDVQVLTTAQQLQSSENIGLDSRYIKHAIQYITGSTLINTKTIQVDITILRGLFTVNNGDVTATRDAQNFSYFYLDTTVNALEYIHKVNNSYLILGTDGAIFHMINLNTGDVYPVSSNGTILGSKIITISISAIVINDKVRVIRDENGLTFYKNNLSWFTIYSNIYYNIFNNRFGFLAGTAMSANTLFLSELKIITKLTSITGISKIESSFNSLDLIFGSNELQIGDITEFLNVGASITKTGSIYNLTKITGTYAWLYRQECKKLQFKTTSNSPTWIVLNANGSNNISFACKGVDTGKVINTSSTVLTQILPKFSNAATFIIALGDEILITYSYYFLDVKIKRVGTLDFVDYFSMDLTALKITIDSVSTECLGFLLIGSCTVDNLQNDILGTIEEKADKAYSLAVELKNSITLDAYYSSLKWGTMGDSITANSGGVYGINYRILVQSLLGIGYIKNVSSSGSMIARKAGFYNDANAMCLHFTLLDNDCSIVTVFGGTNDYKGSGQDGVAMGIKGSIDVYDFYGALKVLIEGIITKLPKAKIAFITPLRRTNDTLPNLQGKTLKNYVDAINEMCNDYSIPVLDMYKIGGINSTNSTILQDDGLHPNTEGYLFIYRKIAKFIDDL